MIVNIPATMPASLILVLVFTYSEKFSRTTPLRVDLKFTNVSSVAALSLVQQGFSEEEVKGSL